MGIFDMNNKRVFASMAGMLLVFWLAFASIAAMIARAVFTGN